MNNIPINGPLLLKELANFFDLEDGKRGTSRLPLYTLLHLKIHDKESGLHSEKNCQ